MTIIPKKIQNISIAYKTFFHIHNILIFQGKIYLSSVESPKVSYKELLLRIK